MKLPDLIKLSRVCGRIFMRLTGSSWRVFYVSTLGIQTGQIRGRAVFFAFWHGRQLPLIHTHRNEGITVLVSQNRDGEYVTNVLHSMGFSTVRGSSSRGGMRALGEMAGKLRNGLDCAITPDGPRGPAEKVKTGLAHISRLGGRLVVPMGTSAWPALHFSSWDSFLLPLPFARVSVVEGRPFSPMKRGDDPDIWLDRIERELSRVTRSADLFTSPSARFLRFILRSAGYILHTPVILALKFRSARERKERQGYVSENNSNPVWLHGSSLGELNGLLPFISYLDERKIPVWITCFTPSGRLFIDRMNLPGSFSPLDTPLFTQRFIRRIKPRALIITETEIWPNTILETLESSIPCMIVNGRLSKRSLKGYRIFKPLLRRMLQCFSGILARSSKDAEYFELLGANPDTITVTGDSKSCSDHGDPPLEWHNMLQTDLPVLVAGSTRRGEEETILKASRKAGYFPVLAPRHLERIDEVTAIMKNNGFSPVRWTEIVNTRDTKEYDSVLLDLHGVLSRLYGVGKAAFVGGTLVPVGGHNVLEPLMRGVPTIVGPHYENFDAFINEISTSGAGYIIASHEELAIALEKLKLDPPRKDFIRTSITKIRNEVYDQFGLLLFRSGVINHLERFDEET
ncbi:MAG: DUF374 domain-containing protein [Candidatus Fermentibacteraceae bacterium]|nr:DUF374 domain-containing protein [Candidatus Fermentibacteraceae bacterium]